MSVWRQVVKRVLTSCVPDAWLLVRGRQPRTRPRGRVRISLTFDDGPHPEHTASVLDALSRAGWTATFFVVGEKALRHPQLLKRIVEQGHRLGNHTWTHAEPSQCSAGVFLSEVERTAQLVQSLTGQTVRWVRPPKGRLTALKLLGLWLRGHSVVLWSVDPRDYKMQTVCEVSRWLEQYEPKDGDVLLLHDRCPWAEWLVQELATLPRFQHVEVVPLTCWLGGQTQTAEEEQEDQHKKVLVEETTLESFSAAATTVTTTAAATTGTAATAATAKAAKKEEVATGVEQ